jgi:hypothetical protein
LSAEGKKTTAHPLEEVTCKLKEIIKDVRNKIVATTNQSSRGLMFHVGIPINEIKNPEVAARKDQNLIRAPNFKLNPPNLSHQIRRKSANLSKKRKRPLLTSKLTRTRI